MRSISYSQADLAGGATFNPKIWAVPPPVLKEVHGFPMQENAQQAANAAARHTAGQASHKVLQNNGVLEHTRLYRKILFLETTLVCVTGGAKLSGSLFVTVTLGQMAKLAFQSVWEAHPP